MKTTAVCFLDMNRYGEMCIEREQVVPLLRPHAACTPVPLRSAPFAVSQASNSGMIAHIHMALRPVKALVA